MKHTWTGFLKFLNRIPLVLRYGLVLASGLILLKTLEYQLFSYRFKLEVYVGLVAVFFTLVGLAAGMGWFNMMRSNPDNAPQPETRPVLTLKEKKLLEGLAQGLSNQQLADVNNLSVNTIKTHLKALYRKLGVGTRHEAVNKGQALKLLD